jgi:hypothetical protein
LLKNSGFYTNRLRSHQIMRSCEAAGFNAELRGVDYWDRVPVPKKMLALPYRTFADDELRIRAIDLVLTPPDTREQCLQRPSR